jgi:soluble lytic murein transglycosylase-like protein
MTTEEIKNLVVSKANQYGINPGIALAQIQRESSFNPRAIGALGERGLGQFTKATWQDYGSGSFDNAFDPVMNLDAWGSYMAYLMGLFSGDYLKALTGYNGGEGHITNPEKYGPPSQAAQNYARAIYSQAGFTQSSVINLDQVDVAPSDFPMWLLIGGIGLLVWFAFSD